MNIVLLDANTMGSDVSFHELEKLGTVTIYGETERNQASERVRDADIILCNKTKMTEETLADALHVKLICVTATGTNNVDFEYTRKRNIVVTNVRGYSSESVAQHTLAMLFYLLEKLRYYDDYVKSGNYAYSPMFTHLDERFFEIKGKTWGIVGLGDIGRRVAGIAKAFGCNVIYYSTSGANNNQDYERVEFNRLLKDSDIISVHAPLNDKTNQLFRYNTFCQMKQTSIFMNLGRGPIVEEDGLARALEEDRIAAAGLDVLCKEPIKSDNPLMKIQDSRKLLITPHIAWASVEARNALVKELYLNIEAYLNGTERNICV